MWQNLMAAVARHAATGANPVNIAGFARKVVVVRGSWVVFWVCAGDALQWLFTFEIHFDFDKHFCALDCHANLTEICVIKVISRYNNLSRCSNSLLIDFFDYLHLMVVFIVFHTLILTIKRPLKHHFINFKTCDILLFFGVKFLQRCQ